MSKFKEIEDFAVFNPLLNWKLAGKEPESVTFKMEDFHAMVTAIESSIIFEINENKKTISGHVVDSIFKCLEGEIDVDEVIAVFNNFKKQSKN